MARVDEVDHVASAIHIRPVVLVGHVDRVVYWDFRKMAESNSRRHRLLDEVVRWDAAVQQAREWGATDCRGVAMAVPLVDSVGVDSVWVDSAWAGLGHSESGY